MGTRDWHINPGQHWANPGSDPDFVQTWPVHCKADTTGADFHRDLDVVTDETFSKGLYEACYSGFEGSGDASGLGLGEWLAGRGITTVEIVGLATDHCVRATALDAVQAGFVTSVLLEYCAGVDAITTSRSIDEMVEAGVNLVTAA